MTPQPPAQPIQLSVSDYDGSTTLSWTRARGDDLSDPGTWSGSEEWTRRAEEALVLRSPITVLEPGVEYHFPPFVGDVEVADVAAAMIAAAAGRGDVTELLDHLPPDLIAADDDENLIY